MNKNQEGALITVLLDNSARDDERDDAAMDLSRYGSHETIEALIRVANDENNPEIVRASCGESLAEIWLRKNEFQVKELIRLKGVANKEATALLQAKKPEWLK